MATKRKPPSGEITIEAPVQNRAVVDGLRRLNRFFSRLRNKLYVELHVKERPLAETKVGFSREHGISHRHFSSLRSDVKQRVATRQTVLANDIETCQRMEKAILKKLAKWERREKVLCRQIGQLTGYIAGKRAWRERGRPKRGKPRLVAGVRREDLAKLQRELASLPFRRHQKKRRLALLAQRRQAAEQELAGKVGVCFGGRSLLEKQHHLKANGFASHEEWRQEWRRVRAHSSFWTGTHSESWRNQNAQFNPDTGELRLRVPAALEDELGSYVVIRNLVFRHRGDELAAVLKGGREEILPDGSTKTVCHPVSYRILEKDPGQFVVQAIFHPLETPPIVTDRRLGAIGVDINADHIAVMEIDRFGNPVKGYSCPYRWQGCTAAQKKAALSDIAAQIARRARESGRPVVAERLDFQAKRASLRELHGRSLRSCLSSFCYRTFLNALEVSCRRFGAGFARVNPAFSSVVGRCKYSGYSAYSLHELAASARSHSVRRQGAKPLREEIVRVRYSDDRKGFATQHTGTMWARAVIGRRYLRYSERLSRHVAPPAPDRMPEADSTRLAELREQHHAEGVWRYYRRFVKQHRRLGSPVSRWSLSLSPQFPSSFLEGLRRLRDGDDRFAGRRRHCLRRVEDALREPSATCRFTTRGATVCALDGKTRTYFRFG